MMMMNSETGKMMMKMKAGKHLVFFFFFFVLMMMMVILFTPQAAPISGTTVVSTAVSAAIIILMMMMMMMIVFFIKFPSPPLLQFTPSDEEEEETRLNASDDHTVLDSEITPYNPLLCFSPAAAAAAAAAAAVNITPENHTTLNTEIALYNPSLCFSSRNFTLQITSSSSEEEEQETTRFNLDSGITTLYSPPPLCIPSRTISFFLNTRFNLDSQITLYNPPPLCSSSTISSGGYNFATVKVPPLQITSSDDDEEEEETRLNLDSRITLYTPPFCSSPNYFASVKLPSLQITSSSEEAEEEARLNLDSGTTTTTSVYIFAQNNKLIVAIFNLDNEIHSFMSFNWGIHSNTFLDYYYDHQLLTNFNHFGALFAGIPRINTTFLMPQNLPTLLEAETDSEDTSLTVKPTQRNETACADNLKQPTAGNRIKLKSLKAAATAKRRAQEREEERRVKKETFRAELAKKKIENAKQMQLSLIKWQEEIKKKEQHRELVAQKQQKLKSEMKNAAASKNRSEKIKQNTKRRDVKEKTNHWMGSYTYHWMVDSSPFEIDEVYENFDAPQWTDLSNVDHQENTDDWFS